MYFEMMLFYIYLLIFMGAFFNACMDTFENSPNFNKSIFKNLNKKFWCKDVSCDYVKLIFGYRFDSWHISKSLMWISIIGGWVVASYVPHPHLPLFIHFIGLASTWNITFPLFYNLIFRFK